jgi:general secretion pathway protein L
MTPQELLNADVSQVGRLAMDGVRWWLDELAEMVPPGLRRRVRRDASWIAQAETLAGPVRLSREGGREEVLAPGAPTPEGQRGVELRLPPAAVLTVEIVLPRMSAADRRRLLELNMDRYTPFTAEQVWFDAVAAGAVDGEGRQRLRLGVVTRSRARAALELAAGLGLGVQRLSAAPGFDFSAALREGTGRKPRLSLRGRLWAGCAVLAVANLVAAVAADMGDVARLERLVDAQRPIVERAARLRQTAITERQRRIDLLTQRSAREPLRIIDAVTRALPAPAWVQRLEWNGRAVRLVGYKPPALDLARALQGPALTNVRSLAAEMQTKSAAAQAPFDVLADSTGKAPR